MGQSASPQRTRRKRLPSRRHSAAQQTAEDLLSRATWCGPRELSPLASLADQVLVLLEQHGNLSPTRWAELAHLASMLIEAMWRVQDRKRGSEASAIAARFDHDIVRRAAEVLVNRWVTQQKVFRRIRRPPREVVEAETRDSIAAEQTITVLELIRRSQMICAKLLRRVARDKARQERERLRTGIVAADRAMPQAAEKTDDGMRRIESSISTQLAATPEERCRRYGQCSAAQLVSYQTALKLPAKLILAQS